ncbi:MAG: hypothetical protein N4A57_04740 [Anaeromicrobium sp.]|jgi:hypothetical protein|uniref:hypothetical protein n=1 Tax=Anaeromicrobium sp. TaxID=1929132 RepID=UPI0025DF0757|nr:hypothetical protein [Anaeromicrobium sp.]MCT4593564.1 hypothetical protein [Anaeromicrobium sp.]
MIRDKEVVIEKLNNFIGSKNKNCLVVGTNVQIKYKNIIAYLNSLNQPLKILIRINSMKNCEYILGFKAKSGKSIKHRNLTIHVDSMQATSQRNTHRNFNCVLVYPIDSLKGINDNNIKDILNYRNSEKIFWISNYDSKDYSYLKHICNVKDVIEINNSDDIIHNRILNNITSNKEESVDKLLVENLNYYIVEESIDKKYNLGGIHTSSMSHELIIGSFDEYIFGGGKSSKRFCIKVLEEKENDKFVLLVKKVK